ncbi:GntR family transcriptional regulator [Haloparvum sedimenti]|uniref:GntR family transcriptional regulator n=1 Tax=Haloparvum sedimenti TaxID=1678448 RepID=UPI00071E8F88|nr:GntR family transcriptional regulator [Haloparvum sedimenti]
MSDADSLALATAPEDVRDRLDDLPLSCRLVYLTLMTAEAPLSAPELSEATVSASSTVRHALQDLADADLVERRPGFGSGSPNVWTIARDERQNGPKNADL